ncbi:3-oxoacyl-[acyl-carrier protein] reductase [Candidatus Velamenicoccus archaeovorus]|uniref:3-oxoacyl-[acyl-carrier protein] reductase n=1 Tax=Velamenicoccus archaeovorus TaxID=1930593 RepID=A0A410P759_VELA1|nr:SDR family NAD(P)-dependent oxidoreductase [Candidatus Velamenicoccus archaeovorus]QAT18047.1 3-oxoacyl-[acyl-carrier protein] reductase [Candidatus Velamenicoccus archaeovorus]
MRTRRVAIVTGADRGIGFQICRQLGELGFQVVLTSPDPGQGKAAAEKLKNMGLAVVYRVLDLLNDRQTVALRSFVMKKFGRVDVLVNNAGISLDAGMSKVEGLLRRRIKKTPRKMDYGEGPGILEAGMNVMRATLEVNTLGALKMCQAFIPQMMKARYGRVINISSTLGQLKDMTDEEKVPAYQLSKTALNAVTKMVADACRGTNVAVNSVCPGWTRTDLGGPEAPQSPEEAAKDIVWLATRPDNGPTGQFFQHRRRIAW